MSRTLALTLLLAACSGPEVTYIDLYPVFTFAPDAVDVGDVGPPFTGFAELQISNAGKKALSVTGDLEESGTFTLPDGPVDLEIGPDDSAAVRVAFTPETFREYKTRLLLDTNDADHPSASVPVLGRGVDLPLPDIAIAPDQTIELPEVPPGESDFFLFEIVNEGDADLHVTELTLDGPPEFVPNALFPGTVPPGGRMTGVVQYDPEGAEGSHATVTILSDDPDEPETTVLLVGNGGGDLELPVAVIDCPTEVLLTGPEDVPLSGAQSYDPAGFEPLSYQWYVAQRPAASDSAVPLDPDDTANVDLRVDVAGTWQVLLLVENAIGTDGIPALCEFEAIPEDDIHVELSWDTPSSDMDLHLNLAGAAMFDVPNVCNWCNKNEDWGTSGPDDDPRLDIDDQGGYGPENINILHPADGGYDVVVHYFEDNGDGPTTATVKIWLDGALVLDDSEVLTANQIWRVGQITWSATPSFAPDGAVGPVGPRTLCF